jgi:hypothetical protein
MKVSMKVKSTPFAAIARGAGLMAADMAELAVNDVGDEADRLILKTKKTGTWYPKNPRRSSAPGESPASQSGKLINSKRITGRGRKWKLQYTAPHAVKLEFGTWKMAPRPFVRRAMHNVMNDRNRQIKWAARAGKNRLGRWWKK